jgi:hypothetical protein
MTLSSEQRVSQALDELAELAAVVAVIPRSIAAIGDGLVDRVTVIVGGHQLQTSQALDVLRAEIAAIRSRVDALYDIISQQADSEEPYQL